jgi:hypothetical protein
VKVLIDTGYNILFLNNLKETNTLKIIFPSYKAELFKIHLNINYLNFIKYLVFYILSQLHYIYKSNLIKITQKNKLIY